MGPHWILFHEGVLPCAPGCLANISGHDRSHGDLKLSPTVSLLILLGIKKNPCKNMQTSYVSRTVVREICLNIMLRNILLIDLAIDQTSSTLPYTQYS